MRATWIRRVRVRVRWSHFYASLRETLLTESVAQKCERTHQIRLQLPQLLAQAQHESAVDVPDAPVRPLAPRLVSARQMASAKSSHVTPTVWLLHSLARTKLLSHSHNNLSYRNKRSRTHPRHRFALSFSTPRRFHQ